MVSGEGRRLSNFYLGTRLAVAPELTGRRSMNSNFPKPRASRWVLVAAIAVTIQASGCSTIKGWMGSDKSEEPSAAEMSELCDMHRKMASMPRDSQDALLESHMKSAHGSSDPQAIARHRQLMLQKCRAG